MRLELGSFRVESLAFGSETALCRGQLVINKAEIREALMDPAFEDVDFEITSPGEEARIIHMVDAVEPRVKIKGNGPVYPGVAAPVSRVGDGVTFRTENMAVITSCLFPLRQWGGIHMVREVVLDTGGPNAHLTPFSETWNLVPIITLKPDLPEKQYEDAVRAAGIKAARYVAQALYGQSPDQVVSKSLEGAKEGLPKVVYVNQLQSIDLYVRNYLYGMAFDYMLPTAIHPNELYDGALTDFHCSGGHAKIPTWFQTNNPVVNELYERHGKSLNFGGVIICRGRFLDIDGKMRCASLVTSMAELMGADGLIATWESAGNTVIETMIYLNECEKLGIKTVLITFELGGADGSDEPLLYTEPLVDAMVSTGTYDRPFVLPKIKRVVGGETIRLEPEIGGVYVPAGDEIRLPYAMEILNVCNNAGIVRGGCVEY
jgi:sarcosine reductase